MTSSRARWAIGLGVVAVAALAAVLYLRQRPAAPPTAEAPAPELPSTLDISEPIFTRWMEFEPPSQHEGLFQRFYVDLMLGHQVFKTAPRGLHPQQVRGLFLEDDDLLFPSGRRLWNKELLSQPGLAGKFCYVHSQYCLKRLFDTHFVVDGRPAVVYDNMYTIERFPSRTVVRYTFGGVRIDEHKFITYDDRAAVSYQMNVLDNAPHTVELHVTAEHPVVPASTGPTTFPLLAQGQYQRLPIFVYLDAPGFERNDAYPFHLRRSVRLEAGTPQRVTVAVSYENAQQSDRNGVIPDDLLERHVVEYQRWFADTVPYFDCPDPMIKKMWYYRWWIVRFHVSEPEMPDLQGFAFYEGKLGFDNLITFAVPAQVKELTYARTPQYALDQARNAYRNRTNQGVIGDAPGSPYWGEMYSQWAAGAVAEYHRVHPMAPETLRELLPLMAADTRGWMQMFDGDKDFLPSRDIPRITGYDLDILSWWAFNDFKLDLRAEPPPQERVDFASFVYANAVGVAELAEAAGDTDLAKEFRELAGNIRGAVLAKLWDAEAKFFFPQTTSDDRRIPVREIHGFFPFTARLAPNERPYLEALRYFVDPQEFWARYPPVITSQAHYRTWTWDMNGLTRNIAPHPISMGALTLIRVLHDYRQDFVTPAHFMELMERYTDLMYPGVFPGDPTWRPNAYEYYSEWEPGSRSFKPKPSDIPHDFHSMYTALVVEGIVGLRPRLDERIELRPAAREWAHFALDRLRYRGHDLTIVWDQPGDGQVRYDGRPEGFSLYIDDQLAFRRPTLDPVVYDPATRAVEDAGG